jgi:opacity protein-like surface antigen
MNRLLTLTLLALAALAAPAAADTVPTYDYAVTIQGTADYNRADIDDDTTAQHDVALQFETEIPRLHFRDGVPEDSHGARGTATVTHGSYVITGGTGTQVRCTTHTAEDTNGGGLDAHWTREKTTFATRVLDSVLVKVGGCDSVMGDWMLPITSGGDEVGVGIFDGRFDMPASRVGEASMTFPLSGEVTGAGCPFNHFNSVLCSLTWEALVTFTRIGEGVEEEVDDDDLLVPIVPDKTPPAPPQPQPQPGPAADLLNPVAAKPRLARNLASASLPFQCDEACTGTLTAKARGRTLARSTARGAADRTVTAVVRFDKRDRRAIRRAKAVQLTLKVKAGARTTRRAVTVRAR